MVENHFRWQTLVIRKIADNEDIDDWLYNLKQSWTCFQDKHSVDIVLHHATHQKVRIVKLKCNMFLDVKILALSKEFDINCSSDMKEMGSILYNSLQLNRKAIASFYTASIEKDVKVFDSYTQKFTCLLETNELPNQQLFSSKEEAIEKIRNDYGELFHIDEHQFDCAQPNSVVALIGAENSNLTFILPATLSIDWKLILRFNCNHSDTVFHSVEICKFKLCSKKTWENYFHKQADQLCVSDFIPTQCKLEEKAAFQNLLSKITDGTEEYRNELMITSNLKEAESLVESIFGECIAEFYEFRNMTQFSKFIDSNLVIYCLGFDDLRLCFPMERVQGNPCAVCFKMGEKRKGFRIEWKYSLRSMWNERCHKYFLQIEEEMLKETNLENQKNLETHTKFFSERIKTPFHECINTIFDCPVNFEESSLNCFGDGSLTVTFIGKWESKESFFKISMQSYESKELMSYLESNQSQITNQPNICRILKYQTITGDLKKIQKFLDMCRLHPGLSLETTCRLANLNTLYITIQERLHPLFPSINELSSSNKKETKLQIIKDSISILNQLESLDIIHRDISFNNLMLRTNSTNPRFQLVLIDFNSSIIEPKERSSKIMKMDSYFDVTKYPYSNGSDWCGTAIGDYYAMAIVLFEILYYMKCGERFTVENNKDDDCELFRLKLLKFIRNENEFEQILEDKSICLPLRKLLDYMLYFQGKPTLIQINSLFNAIIQK